MILLVKHNIMLTPTNTIELANEYTNRYPSYNVIELQHNFQKTLFKKAIFLYQLVYKEFLMQHFV